MFWHDCINFEGHQFSRFLLEDMRRPKLAPNHQCGLWHAQKQYWHVYLDPEKAFAHWEYILGVNFTMAPNFKSKTQIMLIFLEKTVFYTIYESLKIGAKSSVRTLVRTPTFLTRIYVFRKCFWHLRTYFRCQLHNGAKLKPKSQILVEFSWKNAILYDVWVVENWRQIISEDSGTHANITGTSRCFQRMRLTLERMFQIQIS